MNSTASSTPPTLSPWRVSLPAALLVGAVALSCSTACITSAIVQNAAVANNIRENRERISLAVKPLVPASAAQGRTTTRVEVSGDAQLFQVKVTGDFTPTTTKIFLEKVRALYGEQLGFSDKLELLVYTSAKQPPFQTDRFTIDMSAELEALLRSQLGSGAPPTAVETSRLGIGFGGNRFLVFAAGDFTKESAQRFATVADDWRRGFLHPPSVELTIYRRANGGTRQDFLGKFTFPTGPTP